MKSIMKIGAVSALALSTAAPAFAQYYQPTPEYQRQYQDYQSERQQYEARRDRYDDNRSNYERTSADYRAARAAYEARLADWERARIDYDARYGYGAYARIYARPVWDESVWIAQAPAAGYYGSNVGVVVRDRADYRAARRDYERRLAEWDRARVRYDARYGYGAYARIYARPVWDETYWVAQAPAASYYGSNASTTTVRCSNNSTVAAGAIGALVGGVLGSNVAARNAKTEGTVLGAVLGGALGASVGHANDRYKCDSRGPYFSYNETIPYRESSNYRYGSYDTSYYVRQRCRLAAAPVDAYATDYRYVRVCPDADGRYRLVG